MATRRSLATLLTAPLVGVSLLVPPLAGPAGAATGDDPVIAGAVGFLAASQQEDGGFELGGFAGFETADAVLAIGLGAAPGRLDPAAGRARVEAVQTAGGRNGFDAVDDEVETAEGGVGAGRAAKLVVLVALPFGFDVRAFDPSGDGAPVDLVAAIEAGASAGGSYGAFSDTLYAVLALAALDRAVSPETEALIRGAQQPNGGWDFAGDATGDEVDVDVTSLAIEALVALGADATDPSVQGGLALLGHSMSGEAAWGDEQGVNPNSTALAILAVTAAGYDAGSRCWRDIHAPATSDERYEAPAAVLRSLQAADGHIVSPFDSFGVTTFATSQSVQALSLGWLPVERAEPAPCDVTTYATVDAGGGIVRFTPAASGQSAAGQQLASPVVGAADLPGGSGTWRFAADGSVTTSGDAAFHGRAGAQGLNQPIVGGAAAPDGQGYWLVAADGGVFAFGSAGFHGSAADLRLNQPVVGMAAAPDGGGYWLVAADGGIFAFGSAGFAGSTGSIRLNEPVVGMAADPDGAGYWLVAADGGIFAFEAAFLGSTGALTLNQPVVGMDATDDGLGYALVAADGGVFAFGEAPFLGSATGGEAVPTVAITFG